MCDATSVKGFTIVERGDFTNMQLETLNLLKNYKSFLELLALNFFDHILYNPDKKLSHFILFYCRISNHCKSWASFKDNLKTFLLALPIYPWELRSNNCSSHKFPNTEVKNIKSQNLKPYPFRPIPPSLGVGLSQASCLDISISTGS